MVPFFKSKGNFPVSSISAHGGNQVDGLHERLFSLNIGFATAYKLFANESSSRIGMHARRTFETFLSPFEHAQVCCAVIGPHANEEPAPAEPDRTKQCWVWEVRPRQRYYVSRPVSRWLPLTTPNQRLHFRFARESASDIQCPGMHLNS
jgi:hypothetical protein